LRWVDPFHQPELVAPLRQRIHAAAAGIEAATLMEVCGTHTMAIARHGIRDLLPRNVRLVSGPGCPVCVTPTQYVDLALALACQPQVEIATFGDMVRVPGTEGSLDSARASGAEVRVVASTLDALQRCRQRPDRQVVFLAVGFETTAPTVAAALQTARAEGLDNFSILCAHKTIPQALAALAQQPDSAVGGFLCPGHVSVITGTGIYEPLGLPCVVGGFEPLDILLALARLLEQIASGRNLVENAYGRVVRPRGNLRAQEVMAQTFEPCDAVWRGLGSIPGSGLRVRALLEHFDALKRFDLTVPEAREPEGCLCGEILCGRAEPEDCPLFGRACTPENPVGACMVSSEGTCAARHRYGRVER